MVTIESTSSSFLRDADRDACDAIGGFVYQVDLTIRRWIELPEDEILELECGEDIDRVAKAFSTPARSTLEQERLLEQVKRRAASVTLRSSAAVEAVANFALHRARNPEVRLRFRFTSNATAGTEHKAAFPGGQPGIVLWTSLPGLGADARTEVATALRQFYRELKQPEKVPADAWNALWQLAEHGSDQQWDQFLDSFEWSLSDAGPAEIQTVIRQELVSRGFSRDEKEAGEHHIRLFVHVIRLLTNPGEKRLTAAELPTILSAPADRDLERHLAMVFERLNVLAGRLDAVETRVTVLEANASSPDPAAVEEAVAAHLRWSRESYAEFYSVALGRRIPVSKAWNRLRQSERKRRGREDETAKKVLAREERIVVLGGAGAGKSTLCLRLGHEAAERGELALRVSAREVAALLVARKTFARALADLVPCGDDTGRETIAGRLKLLLADGLDECGSNAALVAEKLLDWSRAHPACRIVLTSRPSAVEPDLLPGFTSVELRPLDADEAREMARSLLSLVEADDDADAWSRLEKILPRGRARTRLGEAIRNPLLLSFVVVLAAQGVELDGNRAEVYERIVDAIRDRGRPDRVAEAEPAEPVGRFVFNALGWHLLQDPSADLLDLRRKIAPELTSPNVGELDAEIKFDEAVAFWRARGVLDRAGAIGAESITFVHQSLAEFGAGRRLARRGGRELRRTLDQALQTGGSAAEVLLFAAGAGAANDIAEILLEESPDPWSKRPVLAASVLAEARTAGGSLVAETIRRLAERVASPAPAVAIEAGLALERLAAIAPAADALRPMLDSEQPWTRLASLAPMLAADPDSVPPETAARWLSELEVVERVTFGDRWAEDRALPYAAADLQESALPRAVRLVAQRLPKEEARACFDSLLTRSIGVIDTDLEVRAIVSDAGFADVAERHRIDFPPPDQKFLDHMARERSLELPFLEELSSALALPEPDGRQPDEDLPNLTRIVRTLQTDSFILLTKSSGRDQAAEVLRGIAAATSIDPQALSREIASARTTLSSDEERHLHQLIDDYDEVPQWEAGARVTDAQALFRALTHPSNGIKRAAAYLVLHKSIAEEELLAGLREPLSLGRPYTLQIVSDVALQRLPADCAVDLIVERLGGTSTSGCSHLYEALGRSFERCSAEHQEKIRETVARGLTAASPDAAAAAASVASLFVPADAHINAAVSAAFEHWSIDRGVCSDCGTPLKGDSCPKCNAVARHPAPILLRLRDRQQAFPALDLLDFSRDRVLRDVALELLRTRFMEEVGALTQVLEVLADDTSPLTLPVRLRALRVVFGLPAERLAADAAEIVRLLDSTVAQVRVAYLNGIHTEWLASSDANAAFQRGLADPEPSVRSAAANLARRLRDA